MDDFTVNWSYDRYVEIITELGDYLKNVGYSPELVPFIPISGW